MAKSNKSVEWQKVHIFISSTFNDMHSERDYLVKKVFPRLADWCEKRKIRMVDIDLRWGVSETDTMNKNVVSTCLKNIDECRPFFICLLGQRRGWVPGKDDISKSTYSQYPDIGRYIGNTSVTEMEILHSLISPLHKTGLRISEKSDEYYEPVKHAFFYFRDSSYLDSIPSTPNLLRKIYSNELIEKLSERKEADDELNNWKEIKIPATNRPIKYYSAKWYDDEITPDLHIPLACPSVELQFQEQWRRLWKLAGLNLNEGAVEIPSNLREEAEKFNANFIKGRLGGFKVENDELSEIIFSDLKEAIRGRFPEHIKIVEAETKNETDFQKEIDQQEQFVASNSVGFIQRQGDFDQLDEYIAGISNKLFFVTAPAGMGKSMYLANWVDKYRAKVEREENESIHFRFVGQSDKSTSFYNIWHSIFEEIRAHTGKLQDEIIKNPDETVTIVDTIPADPIKLHNQLYGMLKKIGEKGKTIIVIDALNQLDSGLKELSWLQADLPDSVKVIVSFKRSKEDADAEKLYERFRYSAEHIEIKPFESIEDRKKLIAEYLQQYLKELDQKYIDALLEIEASKNPLYLKIVLGELRIFGAFLNIKDKIYSDFGNDPISAFKGVLKRLENDPAYTLIPPKIAVSFIFGFMANSRYGLSVEELAQLLLSVLNLESEEYRLVEIKETIYLYLRQLRPYLARKEGRYDFFYESFKIAAYNRYVDELSTIALKDFQEVNFQHSLGLKVISLQCKDWNKVIADFFYDLPMWFNNSIEGEKRDKSLTPDQPDENNDGVNKRKVSELPYHLAMAEDWDRAENILGDLLFIKAKCSLKMTFELLRDYSLVIKSKHVTEKSKKAIEPYYDFVRSRSHVLIDFPLTTTQEAYNFADASIVMKQAADILSRYTDVSHTWLKRLNRSNSNTEPCKQTIVGHVGEIKSITISQDGRTLLSVDESELKIWDLTLGICLQTLKANKEDVDYKLTQDGSRVISAGSDGLVRVRNLTTGSSPLVLEGHSGPVKSVELSSDGCKIISCGGSFPGEIKIWDLMSGTCVSTIKGFGSGFKIAVIIDDFKIVLPKGSDKKTHTSQMAYKECFGTIDKNTSYSITAHIWNIATGECLYTFEEPKAFNHNDRITAMTISPDGNAVVAASFSGKIKIWDFQSGKCITQFEVERGHINEFAFADNGKRLLGAGWDQTIRAWDWETGNCFDVLYGHTGDVSCLKIVYNRKFAVSGSLDKTIKLWDLNNHNSLENDARHLHDLKVVKVLANGQRAVTASVDRTAKLWDMRTGRCLRTFEGHKYIIHQVLELKDGQRLLTLGGEPFVGENSEIKLWDLITGNCQWTVPGYDFEIKEMFLTPDSKKVIFLSQGNPQNQGPCAIIRIFNVENPFPLETLTYFTIKIEAIRFSSDGRFIVCVDMRGKIHIYDLNHKSESRIIESGKKYDEFARKLQLSEDGKWIITWNYNNSKLKVWNIYTGKPLPIPNNLDTDEFSNSRVLPATRGLLICTYDRPGVFQIWDLENGNCVKEEFYKSYDDGYLHFLALAQGRPQFIKTEGPNLEVWDLNRNVKSTTYSVEGNIIDWDCDIECCHIVLGVKGGGVHILHFENVSQFVPKVKGWNARTSGFIQFFGTRAGKDLMSFLCPFCHVLSTVSISVVGTGSTCPNCHKLLHLNLHFDLNN